MKIVSTNSNCLLFESLIELIGAKKVELTVGKFNNGETSIDIDTSLRGETTYVLMSGSDDINNDIIEAGLLCHAANYASAKKVVLIVPSYPYARQDRKSKSRDPISARFVADLFTKAGGVDHIIAVELHNGAIQGFADVPMDNLSTVPLFIEKIKSDIFTEVKNPSEDVCVVSPDMGGAKRVKKLAEDLGTPFAIINKERRKAGEVEEMQLFGDVKNKYCILYDDMADSCGTLIKAVDMLLEQGAVKVVAFVTHGILSQNDKVDAVARLEKSKITALYVTDSVDLWKKIKNSTKIKVVSIAPLLACSIFHQFSDRSMESLFDKSTNTEKMKEMLVMWRNNYKHSHPKPIKTGE